MPHQVEIAGQMIGVGSPAFVIAEVGVNHNGDPKLAMKMVEAIARAGADCVKFQTFSAAEFVADSGEVYEYVSQGATVREPMLAMFERLELKKQAHEELFHHARSLGLVPLSTPTDDAALELLDHLDVGAFKIGSDDLVYSPFLKRVARKNKTLILSTGMAQTEEIERAIADIRSQGNQRILLLHCVSQYPTPPQDVNLRKMLALRQEFDLPVGFSDHSMGITAATAAVAMGACVIEKHFTLDRDMAGPDHRFSADEEELAQLVRSIRSVEELMGKPDLRPTVAEREMAKLARRSIVASRDLPQGAVLVEADLAFKRPGTGIMPYDLDLVLGRQLNSGIRKGDRLSLEQLV